MCTEVYVNDQLCTTCGELEAALGGALVMQDDYPAQEYTQGECLCWVDLVSTADLHGKTFKIDTAGIMQNSWAPEGDHARALIGWKHVPRIYDKKDVENAMCNAVLTDTV